MINAEDIKKEFLMIDAVVSDNADNEWLANEATYNTLRPYWHWATDAKVDVQFEVVFPVVPSPEYNTVKHVIAKFNNDMDRRDFIANHTWDLPKTRLKADLNTEPCFVCDK